MSGARAKLAVAVVTCLRRLRFIPNLIAAEGKINETSASLAIELSYSLWPFIMLTYSMFRCDIDIQIAF